jgi:hypothetical protein
MKCLIFYIICSEKMKTFSALEIRFLTTYEIFLYFWNPKNKLKTSAKKDDYKYRIRI